MAGQAQVEATRYRLEQEAFNRLQQQAKAAGLAGRVRINNAVRNFRRLAWRTCAGDLTQTQIDVVTKAISALEFTSIG